jgi:hypothetical protein
MSRTVTRVSVLMRVTAFVLVALLAGIAASGCEVLRIVSGGGSGGGTTPKTTGGTTGGGGGVPLPQPYDYPPADGILLNGSFERDLEGWEVFDQKGSNDPGSNGIETTKWAERDGRVLHVTRTSKQDGGGAGVIQRPQYDCSKATHLWLTYMAYISYEEGGNIADWNPKWSPESGAQARIVYLDAAGATHEYYDGVFITPTDGADTSRFLKIGAENWVKRVSPDLMQLDPKPVRIVEVRLCGFGWGFDTLLDECQIVTGP